MCCVPNIDRGPVRFFLGMVTSCGFSIIMMPRSHSVRQRLDLPFSVPKELRLSRRTFFVLPQQTARPSSFSRTRVHFFPKRTPLTYCSSSVYPHPRCVFTPTHTPTPEPRLKMAWIETEDSAGYALSSLIAYCLTRTIDVAALLSRRSPPLLPTIQPSTCLTVSKRLRRDAHLLLFFLLRVSTTPL